MLAKCANPACLTPFRYVDSGTLFRLETDPWCSSDNNVREYFWLCRGCSTCMTLRLNDAAKVRVARLDIRPLPEENGIDFVLLERQNGMLLSRVMELRDRPRRHDHAQKGQVHV